MKLLETKYRGFSDQKSQLATNIYFNRSGYFKASWCSWLSRRLNIASSTWVISLGLDLDGILERRRPWDQTPAKSLGTRVSTTGPCILASGDYNILLRIQVGEGCEVCQLFGDRVRLRNGTTGRFMETSFVMELT